jgi:riboflavin kinase/FMN adenylyltransferase
MRHLQDLGVDVAFVLTFDHAMSQRSAEAFVSDVLVKGLGAAHIVVGSDFCYGNKRGGNATTLKAAGERLGFGVTAVSPQTDKAGAVYSSTLIRDALAKGDPLTAALCLNRPWEIEGRVEHGDQRGRLLGFPTANVALGEFMHPKLGVYAVKAAVDSGSGLQWIGGVANLGMRPTVGGTRVQLEVHLFDFAGDLYGRHLRVALLGFIRPEMKFSGLDQLKAQIAADSDTAQADAGRVSRAGLARAPGEPAGRLELKDRTWTTKRPFFCRRPISRCAAICRNASRRSWHPGRR